MRLGPFRAIDYAFTIDCDNSELARTLDSIFQHCLAPSLTRCEHLSVASSDTESTLRTDESSRTVANERIVSNIVSHVNLGAAQRRNSDFPVLHAGGVVAGGTAVLLPGRSGSGKSTLVSAFVRGGSLYLADELIAIRTPTMVTGYPKAITLKEGSWPALGTEKPPVSADHRFSSTISYVRHETFHDHEPAIESAPGAVLFPKFDAASPTSLRAITPGEATTVLSACAYLPWSPSGFETLARMAASVRAWHLTYPNTEEACNAVARTLADTSSIEDPFIEVGRGVEDEEIPGSTAWADFGTELVIANTMTNTVVHLDEDGRNQWLAITAGEAMQPELRQELERLGVVRGS